jgi:hypothetical protein
LRWVPLHPDFGSAFAEPTRGILQYSIHSEINLKLLPHPYSTRPPAVIQTHLACNSAGANSQVMYLGEYEQLKIL